MRVLNYSEMAELRGWFKNQSTDWVLSFSNSEVINEMLDELALYQWHGQGD